MGSMMPVCHLKFLFLIFFFEFKVGLLSDKMLVGLSSLAITLSSKSQQDENPGVAGWVLVENSMGKIFVLSLSYNFVGKMGDSSSVLYKGLQAFLSQISSGLKHHPRKTSSSFTVHFICRSAESSATTLEVTCPGNNLVFSVTQSPLKTLSIVLGKWDDFQIFPKIMVFSFNLSLHIPVSCRQSRIIIFSHLIEAWWQS